MLRCKAFRKKYKFFRSIQSLRWVVASLLFRKRYTKAEKGKSPFLKICSDWLRSKPTWPRTRYRSLFSGHPGSICPASNCCALPWIAERDLPSFACVVSAITVFAKGTSCDFRRLHNAKLSLSKFALSTFRELELPGKKIDPGR